MRIKTSIAYALFAYLFFAAGGDARACSCIHGPVARERKHAALIFAGQAVDVVMPDISKGEYSVKVTFDVYQSWDHRAARTVTVETSPSGASCGYVPEKGGFYVIFAHRHPDKANLQIGLCSNNVPLACAKDTLAELRRPIIQYKSLPSTKRWGTNELPFTAWTSCVQPPQSPPGANLDLPRGVTLRNFTARILKDGTARDVSFDLSCQPAVTALCTADLADRIRATIAAWRYQPAQFEGRAVAYRFEYR